MLQPTTAAQPRKLPKTLEDLRHGWSREPAGGDPAGGVPQGRWLHRRVSLQKYCEHQAEAGSKVTCPRPCRLI